MGGEGAEGIAAGIGGVRGLDAASGSEIVGLASCPVSMSRDTESIASPDSSPCATCASSSTASFGLSGNVSGISPASSIPKRSKKVFSDCCIIPMSSAEPNEALSTAPGLF